MAAVPTAAAPTAPPANTVPQPSSGIEAVVPPWETGPVQWPVPYQFQPPKEWLPELANPWIPGIDQRQRPVQAQPQTPPPGLTPVYVIYAVPPTTRIDIFSPDERELPDEDEPMVKVIPRIPKDNALYQVQVGAFKSRLGAQDAIDRLKKAGFTPDFEEHKGLTRVLIPDVRGREVRNISQRLYRAGFREVWIR
jgi:cell division septation protein DedD